MDPITAFQVAGTVITFVEFSRDLLDSAREVYKSPSGATTQVVRLGSIANDLSTAGERITETLRNNPASSRTGSDETLVKICERCTVLKNELQEALQGLEARGDTKLDLARRSIAVAFKSIWSQSKINDLDRRLREVQFEMQMAVLMSLWEEERIQGRSRQGYLDQNMDAILASVNRTDQRLNQFMQDMLQTSSYQSPEGINKRSMLFRELWKADWRPDQHKTHGLETSSSDEVAHFIQQDVINSLWFEEIESRDKAISETYESTYEWILDPDGSTGFVPWMEEDRSLLYWITGKAGSGKSTLIKYLAHHESTTQHLKNWASGLPLLFCHFYFWEATTEKLQRCREGLLRTLLWQCLEKNPDLVSKITPRRWTAYQALRGWEGLVPEWNWEELQETFLNLASLNNSSFKLVIFIDGLDEFNGDPGTLIQWIKDIITKFSVKLCVGSRPWTAFSDAFEQYPTLTMQTLTVPDLQTYINGHFGTSRAFKDWQSLSPDGTEALRQELIEKADGVFLWVYIVVRELMSALEKGKNLNDLSDILSSLPTDIMNLYTKIYGGADPEETKRAALYFELLKAAMHKLTCYELWSIEENMTIDPNDTAASMSMERIIKRRLDSSTRGMVEVSAKELVVFHHRSVREWLLRPEVLPTLLAQLPDHFDARLLLIRGYRARLAQVLQPGGTFNEPKPHQLLCSSSRGLHTILYYASQVKDSPILTPALCQELELARDTFDQTAESIEMKGGGPFAEIRAEFNSSMPQRLKAILQTTRNRGKLQGPAKVDKYEIGHWSFCLNEYRSHAQGCFTARAAQSAVYPYVVAQVRGNPDLLEEKDDRLSLLHSAIFGLLGDEMLDEMPSVDYQLRLRLIEALLDSGASVRGRMHIFGKSVIRDMYYSDAIDHVEMGKLREIGPKEYWDEVRQLLTVKMSKGTRFRRSLRAMVDKTSR